MQIQNTPQVDFINSSNIKQAEEKVQTENTAVEDFTHCPRENRDILQYIKENPEYRPTLSEKAVVEAIEKANKKLMGANTEFEFSIHEKTKQIMVKVVNSETKEVIREIPPEKVLDMVAKMCEMAGILVDEKR